MKFCEQCGANLEDSAKFCKECGSAQNLQKKPAENIHTVNKKMILGLAAILIVSIAVGVFGGYLWYHKSNNKLSSDNESVEQKEEQDEERQTDVVDSNLRDSIEWKEDKEKIEVFKTLSVNEYPETTIGEVFAENYTVNKWQYGIDNNVQYLLCNYVDNDLSYVMIFYQDIYENVNIAEYYVDGEKQDKETLKVASEEIFKAKKFSEKRVGFFTNGKWAMEITSVDSENNKIEYYSYWWDFTNERMEQSETDVKSLEILGPDTMGNEDYTIQWNGLDSFTMKKYDCELLFNNNTIGSREGRSEEVWESGIGEFKRAEKPENIPISDLEIIDEPKEETTTGGTDTSQANDFIRLPQVPPDGIYWEGNCPPAYAKYYVEVSNTQDDRFDFKIYQAQSVDADGWTSDFQLVFKQHTAIFTDAYHAVYEGKQYTLYFECGSNLGYMTISGFSEVIPDGSELYNNEYLGVS